ncbi:hypothetical protein COL940_014406, partial [Colletotrichum noveboracense]
LPPTRRRTADGMGERSEIDCREGEILHRYTYMCSLQGEVLRCWPTNSDRAGM